MLGSLLPLLSVIAWLPALQPFDAYAGHCWKTTFPDGAVDRHCFTVVFDGKHVRDAHIVAKDGRAVYAGETIYSVEKDTIVFTYWNSLGGIGRGTAEATGNDIRFSLTMRATPNGAAQPVETFWHRTAQGYDTTSAGQIRHFVRDD